MTDIPKENAKQSELLKTYNFIPQILFGLQITPEADFFKKLKDEGRKFYRF